MNTSNRRRRVGAQSRSIDVAAMRESARVFLGWEELTGTACADFLDINPRTWRRYESKELIIADSQIKLFWYEVALTKLENLEDKELTDEALKKALGGEPTVRRVYDYLHNAWEHWDPAQKRADGR